jgi:hypothetical protein
MAIEALVVLIRSIPNNGNDMMDLIDLNVDYSLFLDWLQLMVIQEYVDEVDIENKKNYFLLKKVSIAVVDAYKIMDLLIAKMNYPKMYH